MSTQAISERVLAVQQTKATCTTGVLVYANLLAIHCMPLIAHDTSFSNAIRSGAEATPARFRSMPVCQACALTRQGAESGPVFDKARGFLEIH